MEISPIGMTTAEHYRLSGRPYLSEEDHGVLLEYRGYIEKNGIWIRYKPKLMDKPSDMWTVYSVIGLFHVDCPKLVGLRLSCSSNEECIKCVKYLLEQKCQLQKLIIKNYIAMYSTKNSYAFDLTMLKDLCLSSLTILGDKYTGLSELLDHSDITELQIFADEVDFDPEVDTQSLIVFHSVAKTNFQRLIDLCERNRTLSYNIKSARLC